MLEGSSYLLHGLRSTHVTPAADPPHDALVFNPPPAPPPI